ncbi:exodeoxyribonuclease VII large subunit [Marivirga atlantica]|jgi:exodeoxyribonuclease VII large subunit|uniref:Exodeoxyribonuclease 7 large subunit n=1 Tax=Marivirga atlantica TaxID=1548457 RepID=A0A937ACV7_9BACT|nr:exodeoxyribonuclease VII large subunit [Marivirga atlantica]MBL0766631.1 exodeoxyribonuclease VII large subunit [Marivirga atlantica]
MEHLSLATLNQLIKDTLNTTLEPSYWVVAEIAELRTNYSGHCYLEFIQKEEESGKVLAKIRGTIWSYTYRTVSAWFQSITGEELRSGLTVLANVQVQFHEVYGLSLNVKDIDPNFTLGERARKKQEIIKQLEEDGIFEMNKSLKLPLVPQRIAVISSETAAGYGDFMNQITHNDFGYKIETLLFPATMQGDKAPDAIINALLQVHNAMDKFDAVIIIRGGGAQVDLDCFDHYELAAHIAQFPLPVFTGIGHERDETICDLVAHTSLKTPTAVAEFLLRGIRQYDENITILFENIASVTSRSIEQAQYNLREISHRFKGLFVKRLDAGNNKLDRLSQQLNYSTKRLLSEEANKLQMIEKTFHLINPENVFKKGYSFTSKNGKSINGQEIKEGDQLITTNSSHRITSEVKKIDIEK